METGATIALSGGTTNEPWVYNMRTQGPSGVADAAAKWIGRRPTAGPYVDQAGEANTIATLMYPVSLQILY